MPKLTPYDLPLTQERIYDRAREIVRSWGKSETDLEWTPAIMKACDEARLIERQLH